MKNAIKNRKVWMIALSAYVAAMALFAGSGAASAAYRRVHATACKYGYDDQGTITYYGNYLFVTNGSPAREFFCNAPSDSTLPHGSTVTLNVHGYAPTNNQNYSRSCARNYNSWGDTCGPVTYWPQGHTGALNVSTSGWTSNALGFPYVSNYLFPGSYLHGFYMAN